MADYGAGVEGVTALLPGTRIDESSRPNVDDVEAWVDEYTAEVARRLGDLAALDPDAAANAELTARRLVHLAAAATVLDAKYPERAGAADDSYAAVLWGRYTTGLAELVEAVEEGVLPGPGDGGTTGGPGSAVGSFPEPMFTTTLPL